MKKAKNKIICISIITILIIAVIVFLFLKAPTKESLVINSVEDCKRILPSTEKYCEFNVEPGFSDINTQKEALTTLFGVAPNPLALIEQNICLWHYAVLPENLNALFNQSINQSEAISALLSQQRAQIAITYFKNQSIANQYFDSRKESDKNAARTNPSIITIVEFSDNYYETKEINSAILNQSKKVVVNSIYKKVDNVLISITQTYELNENPPCDLSKLKDWADNL